MVSAFATSAKLMLDQEKVDNKSNEITAIPRLLDLLSIKGVIVSIDAMGTQKKTAKKIRDRKADYVLSLKENQSTLHDNISLYLQSEIEKARMGKNTKISDIYIDHDKGHGRIEQRTCYVTDQIEWLEWCDLKTVAIVEKRL